MFCIRTLAFFKCWHLSTVTVKGHSSPLVTSGNAGVFKMLLFCIRTLVFFKFWHLWTMTVKGHSDHLVMLGNSGALYMNTGVFQMLAPVDSDCQGT